MSFVTEAGQHFASARSSKITRPLAASTLIAPWYGVRRTSLFTFTPAAARCGARRATPFALGAASAAAHATRVTNNISFFIVQPFTSDPTPSPFRGR